MDLAQKICGTVAIIGALGFGLGVRQVAIYNNQASNVPDLVQYEAYHDKFMWTMGDAIRTSLENPDQWKKLQQEYIDYRGMINNAELMSAVKQKRSYSEKSGQIMGLVCVPSLFLTILGGFGTLGAFSRKKE